MYRRAELLQLRAQAERSQVLSLQDELQAKMLAQAQLEGRLYEQQAEADEERRRLERLHMLLLENSMKVKEEMEMNRELIEKVQKEEAAQEQRSREKLILHARLAALRAHVINPAVCITDTDVEADLDLSALTTAALPSGPDGVHVDRTVCKGYLIKLGRMHKTWLKRWFVLSLVNKKLIYYTAEDEKARKGWIDLADLISVVPQYTPEDTLATFHVMTPFRTYHLRTANMATARVWLDILRAMVAG